jgi:hypothetical protein
MTLAPGIGVVMAGFEMRRFSKIPKPAKDFLAASPNASLVWKDSWQHWDIFPDMQVSLGAMMSLTLTVRICMCAKVFLGVFTGMVV